MTQEERSLLMTDLCGRIPYGVKVHIEGGTDGELASVDWWEEVGLKDGTTTLYPLEDVKPYLRPMSDMTDEEIDKMWEVYENNPAAEGSSKITDLLNKWGLDHHHLIEKGLALEAPDGMYEL